MDHLDAEDVTRQPAARRLAVGRLALGVLAPFGVLALLALQAVVVSLQRALSA